MLEELNSEKGSRYSDSIVDLILNDDELQIQLRNCWTAEESLMASFLKSLIQNWENFKRNKTI